MLSEIMCYLIQQIQAVQSLRMRQKYRLTVKQELNLPYLSHMSVHMLPKDEYFKHLELFITLYMPN